LLQTTRSPQLVATLSQFYQAQPVQQYLYQNKPAKRKRKGKGKGKGKEKKRKEKKRTKE
jgi:hypothetical protein